MRLLIALSDRNKALAVQSLLYAQDERWDVTPVSDGLTAARLLEKENWELLLLEKYLPGMSGEALWTRFLLAPPLRPPRALLLWPEGERPAADCVALPDAAPRKLAALLSVLAQKPLPLLAAARLTEWEREAESFLELLGMRPTWKGRRYAAWCLARLIPLYSPAQCSAAALYEACAAAFGSTAGAVERCVRVAVEGAFTRGSMPMLERFFGATADPDKGKPTNRAFLLEAARQLRLLLDCGTILKEQGNAPQTRRAHDGVNDPAPDGGLPAEDPGDQIELEHADQRPVDRADHYQRQGGLIQHALSSFPEARGLFSQSARKAEERCASGRKQA